MTRLTVDRLMPIIFGLLLLAQWAGAEYFYRTKGFITASPFSPMWATYTTQEAAVLVAYSLAGLGLALLIPLGRGMPVVDLLTRTRDTATRLASLWMAVSVVSVVLITYVKLPYILLAPAYLMTQGPAPLVSLSTVMGPLGALASGALSTRRPVIGTALGIALGVLLFASATRVLCAIPLLFLIGRYIGGARVSRLAALAVIAFAYLSLPIPLISRSQATHGLIPYTHALGPAVFNSHYLTDVGRVFGENVGMTIPLMVYVSHFNITWNEMLISVNPLPAQAAGWSDIVAHMRVHDFIPFSSLGEWSSFGPIYLLMFIFTWTLIIRACVASVSTNLTIMMMPIIMVGIAIASLTVLEMGQYNTRAIARLMDLLVLVAVLDRLTRPYQLRLHSWLVNTHGLPGAPLERTTNTA